MVSDKTIHKTCRIHLEPIKVFFFFTIYQNCALALSILLSFWIMYKQARPKVYAVKSNPFEINWVYSTLREGSNFVESTCPWQGANFVKLTPLWRLCIFSDPPVPEVVALVLAKVLVLIGPKRNLLLFPVTRPTRQKAADSVNFMA